MYILDIYHSEIPEFINEAIEAIEMQRLKDVGMNCGCEYTSFPIYQNGATYSRYEHSIGVALIIWHFTNDIAQSLSGLFHDISTPCFAHVIDFLNNDHLTQSSTEEKTEFYIENSKVIQKVLKKYGLTTKQVSDYHNYPIADNDTPRLSSDRLEYTLGNLINFEFGDKNLSKRLYDDLTVGISEEGVVELMFKSEECASIFTQMAIKCSTIYECDSDRYSMQSLALLLKQAVKDGIITSDDFYTTEPEIIEKLTKNQKYNELWKQYRKMEKVYTSQTPKDGYLKIFAKKRYINPYVLNKGRITDINPQIKEELETFVSIKYDYYVKAM